VVLLPVGAVAKVGGFLKGVVTSPWFWAVLVVAGLGTGTYFYLKNDKKEAVAAATTSADQNATTKSYETDRTVADRTKPIDQAYQQQHDQSIKDYAHVRETITAAPQDERDAQAPALLIRTLNELDRLRALRNSDPDTVSNAEVPVG
jgi:uncharacterized protein HemX